MYFEFEDHHPETPQFESAISRREGVLLSLVVHALFVVAILVVPQLPVVKNAIARADAERAHLAQLELQRQRESQQRFVFVQPRLDLEAPAPPPRPELSDRDRVARAPEKAENPANPLPFARGNSSERIDAAKPSVEPPRPEAQKPAAGSPDGQGTSPEKGAAPAPPGDQGPKGPAYNTRPPGAAGSRSGLSGAIENALRNIERYVPESFNNPQGGVSDFGSTIQFDTKGVEFGPWIRRFVAHVKRNWFVPYAAMSLRGHVVITFYVHKDGSISDLTVLKPSSIESFTTAAFNALAASNPTMPLPPEYPSDRAFFTVTFYYNENPREQAPVPNSEF